jgi:hypothetical protein
MHIQRPHAAQCLQLRVLQADGEKVCTSKVKEGASTEPHLHSLLVVKAGNSSSFRKEKILCNTWSGRLARVALL